MFKFFTAELRPYLFLLLSFFFGIVLGVIVCYSLFPKTITNYVEIEKPIVHEVVKYIDKTEVSYIPKENDENTDIQIDKTQPVINVKYNDKNYPFQLKQKEEQKFDKGKLVVNQSGSIDIDIKHKEDERNWTLKLGQSNHGLAGGIDYRLGNIINTWTYFDKKTQAIGVGVKF